MSCCVAECKESSYVQCGPDSFQCLDHAEENLKEQCFDFVYHQQLLKANNPLFEKSMRKYMDDYIIGLKESKLFPEPLERQIRKMRR